MTHFWHGCVLQHQAEENLGEGRAPHKHTKQSPTSHQQGQPSYRTRPIRPPLRLHLSTLQHRKNLLSEHIAHTEGIVYNLDTVRESVVSLKFRPDDDPKQLLSTFVDDLNDKVTILNGKAPGTFTEADMLNKVKAQLNLTTFDPYNQYDSRLSDFSDDLNSGRKEPCSLHLLKAEADGRRA